MFRLLLAGSPPGLLARFLLIAVPLANSQSFRPNIVIIVADDLVSTIVHFLKYFREL
jgi:hypothetical protein